MPEPKYFLSLKWKFSLFFGVILIALYSLYSYLAYHQAVENFTRSRLVAVENQINIARALTQSSFTTLDRFSESVSLMHEKTVMKASADEGFINSMRANKNHTEQKILLIIQLFNDHWEQWQTIWQLDNVIIYNQQGIRIKAWGQNINHSDLIFQVLSDKQTKSQIICQKKCFQMMITPISSGSELVGALGISLSLSDTLDTYQAAINSDIAVINHDTDSEFSSASYSNPNNKISWNDIHSNYPLKELTQQAVNFKKAHKQYEVRAFPVSQSQKAPYFLIINDVTEKYQHLQNKFSSLAITGLLGLLIALIFLLISIQYALAKISTLSKALPLITQQRYQAFKSTLNYKAHPLFGDELDQLSSTATQVVVELEDFQTNTQEARNLLINKTLELQSERDFSTQLINTAPIIIITQNAAGEILSINQEGLRDIHLHPDDILGKEFSELIPETETEHLYKLIKLRTQNTHQEISFSGRLNLQSEELIFIDWIHTTFHETISNQEAVILSLGVDVTDRHNADKQLIWLASHDQLTGLSNRRYFQTEFDTMLSIAKRYHEQVALLYLDLDQFKVINDSYGHKAGDELLQTITQTLSQLSREGDLLSRIGGDEFALVMPTTTQEDTETFAKELLHTLKILDYKINERSHPISFSIGIAIYPEHGKTQQELLANADLAMYQAKKLGRSRYHVYNSDFEYQAILTEQLRWKHVIERAMEEDQFVLFFQPILDIKNQVISHYECLLRIELESGRILMPADFINHAEETGIIEQLDRIVLKKAIQQHLTLQKQGNNAKLTINISGTSMNNIELLGYIKALLAQTGVKPELLIFEITETSAVSNFASAEMLISQVTALGCQFALDDFGVGFSSFYYLKSLAVDYVKIDGSFVRQMDINEDDRIFVKVLTEVSQAFGKKVVAEFVENKEILELLKQQGVEYAQGFYISKPLRNPLDLRLVKGIIENK
ncbi:MAG: EAL domain-containing protein [Methyloprofundus sp.]|nr:EAL domain-containing protein [Methyloprofundus sp.]